MIRQSMNRAFCTLHCAFLFICVLLLPACVTQRRPVSPAAAAGARQIPRTEIQHAPEPLATPVPSSETIRSHVRLSVRPLGSIEYDGQVLPLVSPDGRHIAASTGAAPSWPALLGEPGATPPAGARIVTYVVPPFKAAGDEPASVSRARELPHAALLLGRSTNDDGFLVESPRPDGLGEGGSRWIGFAHWDTCALDWLVRDDGVNANAALAPNNALAFTRRKDANSPAELVFLPRVPRLGADQGVPRLAADQGVPRLDAVLRGAAVRPSTTHELTWRPSDPDTNVIAPIFNADDQLFAFVIHTRDTDAVERGVELLAFTLTGAGLTVESRIHLSPSTNPLWIHQALAPMNGAATTTQAAPPHTSHLSEPNTQHSTLTFFHPGRRNIVTWRPDRTADSQPARGGDVADADEPALIDWAPGSVAWAPAIPPAVAPPADALPAPAAAFLTTSEGLIYQANPTTNQTTPDLALARALATSGIARATTENAHFLLLAPSRTKHRNVLDLYEFRLPADQPAGGSTPLQEP